MEYLLSKFIVTPWAVHPGMLDIFSNVLNNKFMGELIKEQKVSDDENKITYYINNGAAIIPMHGTILKKSMGMQSISGLETTLNIEKTISQALYDDKVDRIILDIDSPGGSVDGTMELASFVHEAKSVKPIVAYANGMMASAAYWIGSAADKVYTYHTGNVGSIGVYMMHVDQSKLDEKQGLNVTYIKAGKYKTTGNVHEPLNETDKNSLQEHVDYVYSLFVNDVAKFRGYTSEEVINNMADGKIFIGQQAVDAGLVDEINNLESLLEQSNTYSFLTGGTTMFGVKWEDVTVESLTENKIDVYNAIVSNTAAEYEQKIKDLEKQITDMKEKAVTDEKIRNLAETLNLHDLGEELIKENASVTDAYEKLAEAAKESVQNNLEAFENTAPTSAGPAGTDELDREEPQTKEEAMSFCREKYQCSKGMAWKHARRDFPKFFITRNINEEGGN